MTIKAADVARAFEDIARHIDQPAYMEANIAFTTGFLLGGDSAGGAALVVALVEKAWGPDARGLSDLKRKIGLGACQLEDFAPPR